MITLRVLCLENDHHVAVMLSGPCHVKHKTFDVTDQDDIRKLANWIAEAEDYKYNNRSIVGVEVLGISN